MFYSHEKDGITQSLLKTWMTCRKMADLSLQGWTTNRQSYALTYGTIIHAILEIVYDGIRQKKITQIPPEKAIQNLVSKVKLQWLKENPTKDPKVLAMLEECLLIAEVTLPEYFKFWWKMDFKEIKWRDLEQSFKVPYTTLKGDKTFIRGKKDGVYGLKDIKLFETKTKSQINLNDLIDTLWFEFQVNIYIWAIKKTYKQVPAGINYNILRKTSLTRYVSESLPEFGNRIRKDIKKRPEFYFIRLNITIQNKDTKIFEEEFEHIVQDFIDWRKGKLFTYKNTSECITKYGRCPYLDICSKGDYTNYHKRKLVFSELTDN